MKVNEGIEENRTEQQFGIRLYQAVYEDSSAQRRWSRGPQVNNGLTSYAWYKEKKTPGLCSAQLIMAWLIVSTNKDSLELR